MADGVDIGTLSGKIEFEDHASQQLDAILKKVTGLEQEFGGLGSRVAESAAGFFTAEAAMKALSFAADAAKQIFQDMLIEGAGVADVQENFERLTAQAGRLSATLLGELKEGTHNTIDDLTLMKMVNADLAAGMNLTDKQFRTLADGAFALAQATGTDVAQALETMNDAMVTGRVRSVQMLTGKIDLEAAERRYADSLGTTVDRLSAEGKVQAARVAILEAVGNATERLGEQTDGLDEMWAQAQTAAANYYAELQASIATNPEVIAAFVAVKDALVDTFGGDKTDMIKTLTGWMEGFAGVVQEFGPPTVEFLGEVASALKEAAEWLAMDWNRSVDFFHKVGLMVQGYSNAEANAVIETQKLMKAQEQAARAAAAQEAALQKAAEQANAVAEGAKRVAEVDEKNKMILKETNEEIKKRAEAQKEIQSSTKDWHETVKLLDKDMVEAIKTYMEAGVAQDKLATAYGLTATQITAVSKALKEEKDLAELEQKQINDSIKRWADYNAMRTEMSGTYTDQVIADIQRWRAAQVKAHVQAKTDTADFYNWLEASERQMLEASDRARLESDSHSKAYWDRQKAQAEDAYAFALAHADQFTQGYIDDLRKTKEAATDAATHWKDQLGGALDDVTGKVKTLSGEMITLAEAKARREAGGSMEINRGNLGENLKTWKIPETVGMEMAKKGFSFQEILQAWQSGTVDTWIPRGPRIPGFREGGFGDFGDGTLVMLHGKEAVIPLDKMNAAGTGSITNNFYVNGTAQDVARKVSDEIMRRLKQAKHFGSA